TVRPDVVEAEANMVRTVLLTEAVLSRVQKEYILLVISAANLNTYCVAVHCEMLRALGVPPDESDQIAMDHRHAPLTPADKALLDFALKLATRPTECCQEDIDLLRKHGFTDEQILESAVMTGLTNFLNTLQVGLGTVPDFAPKRVFRPQETNLFPAAARPMAGTRGPRPGVDPVEDADAGLVARVQGGNLDAF